MKVLILLLAATPLLLFPARRLGAAPAPRKLTNIQNAYPSFSPDGTKVLFQSDRTGNWEVFVMNADGSNPRQFTDHGAADVTPSW
jgi:Tol biopolymer transport system component